MKLLGLLSGFVFVFLYGCNGSGSSVIKTDIEVEIFNQSTIDMENAHVVFGKYICKWGWVSKSTSKGYMFYPHPITADAELHWDEVSGHRMEKIDLRKIYLPGKSGRLTFTVYDDRVEVAFREKP